MCVLYSITLNESRYNKKLRRVFYFLRGNGLYPTILKRMLVIPVYKHLILYAMNSDVP